MLLVLRANWLRILGPALAVGVGALLLLFLIPNYYRARAVLSPTGEDSKQGAALGALASIGLPVGGASRIEDLESLIRSHDLTVQIFGRNDTWGDTLGSKYDPASKTLRPGLPFRLWKTGTPPTDWDAIRYADEALLTGLNRKAGTLTITFEALSPESSARILALYLEAAKTRMQQEALDRAAKNKAFLEAQLAKTSDPLSRDRLFSTLGQEIDKEMMAHNREQFGFRVIDAPRVPDRKAGPARSPVAVALTMACLVGLSAYHLFRHTRRRSV